MFRPKVEVLEDRTAPAMLLGSGNHLFATDPGDDLIVPAGASAEFTADVTTHHSITSDNGIIRVDAGCTLICPAINGGALAGPGTFVVGSISNAKLAASATVQAASLSGVTSNAFLTLGGGTLTQFINGSGGRLLINGSVAVNGFQSQGRMIVSPIGAFSGDADLLAGSVTAVQRAGPLDNVDDGMIWGNITITGGLLENHGVVGTMVSVGAGAKAIGSGIYLNVITSNGGSFSPGGSPGTLAVFGGDTAGSVTTTNTVTTGTLTVFDPDAGQAVFQPTSKTTLYGSFTIDAAGHWTYTLDPARPETVLALAHVAAFNDPLASVRSLDGTEFVLDIRIAA